jgi:hypothetical protein
VKRPVRPANMALPVRCDAAPVDEEGEGEEDVELPVRLPPEPATAVGDTFSVASAEAFLKAASVFAPDLLIVVRGMIVLEGNDDNLRRVNHTNHAVLAVLALCAVEPDRCRGILDFVGEGGVGESLGTGSWDETGPEAVGQRLARRVEGSLGDGVILGPKVESDGVALSGGKVARVEGKRAGLVGYDNLVVLCESSASEGSSEDGSGEKHYE